jgi:hypothetical protein
MTPLAESDDLEEMVATYRDLLPDDYQDWVKQPDPRVSRNRRQILECFPIVAVTLLCSRGSSADEMVQSVIDTGQPLVTALSRIAGVKPSTVRLLRGQIPGGLACTMNIVALLRALEKIPPGKRPRTKVQWELFEDLLRWSWSSWVKVTPDQEQLYELTEHIWLGLMTARPGFVDRYLGEQRQYLNGIQDYLRFVGEWCACGAGEFQCNAYVKPIARSRLRDEVLLRYSAIEIATQSYVWHCEINNVEHLADHPDDEWLDHWPSLPGLPYQSGDITIMSLTSRFAVIQEGARLEHCAGSYVSSCRAGDTHIVSIRNADGESLSTAELSVKLNHNGKYVLAVEQHRSRKNNPPSKACVRLLDRYLAVAHAEIHQQALAEVDEFHRQRRIDYSALLEHCDEGMPVEAICRIMAKILPDHEKASDCLVARLIEEDAWYQYQNELANQRLQQYGLDENLSFTEAWEVCRNSGQEDCLDAGLQDPAHLQYPQPSG